MGIQMVDYDVKRIFTEMVEQHLQVARDIEMSCIDGGHFAFGGFPRLVVVVCKLETFYGYLFLAAEILDVEVGYTEVVVGLSFGILCAPVGR